MSVTRLPNRSEAVDRFLDDLGHPRVEEIEAIRAIILGCDPAITERIKWNAPSNSRHGDDRVTFRRQPRNIVQLDVHHGAKMRAGRCVAPDRATLTFAGRAEVRDRRDALAGLVRAWIAAG